jgi:glycosyltransferase involved in cell wall biosynthesis
VRVIIVSGIFPPDIGGPATHAADLADELRERGHGVTVLSLWDQPRPERVEGRLRYPRGWPWVLRSAAGAMWLLRHRGHYDVVYATGMGEVAVLGARVARRPVVVKIVGDPAWERGSRLGLADADFAGFQHLGGGGWRVRSMRRLRNWTVRNATAVITPSLQLKEAVEQWSGGRADVTVIPNGVRAKPVRGGSSEQEGVDEDLRLIFVGRLIPHKRLDLIIEAVARVENVSLRVVGEGPERDSLEGLVRKHRLEGRVRFTGPVDHGTVIDLLAAADGLVLASTYEGLPHVAIEALVCGAPVLTADIRGAVDVVRDGIDGVIVDPPTAEAFAAVFEKLRTDRTLLAGLKQAAATSGQGWEFGHCADRVEALLRGLHQSDERRTVLRSGR